MELSERNLQLLKRNITPRFSFVPVPIFRSRVNGNVTLPIHVLIAFLNAITAYVEYFGFIY